MILRNEGLLDCRCLEANCIPNGKILTSLFLVYTVFFFKVYSYELSHSYLSMLRNLITTLNKEDRIMINLRLDHDSVRVGL